MLLTLYGLTKVNPEIMSVNVPEGIDRDSLWKTILYKSGQLYPYIQEPQALAMLVQNWFSQMHPQFSRMVLALTTEYNPLENYDRHEDTHRTTNSIMSGSSSGSTTGKRAGYDSADLQTVDGSSSSSSTEDRSGGEDTYSAHLHGNIGVTMASQMLEAELNVRRVNIYNDICRMFEKEFLMEVY